MSELDAPLEAYSKKSTAAKAKDSEADDAQGGTEEGEVEKSDYDYLLGMNLWSLTHEKVEEIKKQLKIKEDELKELKKKTIEQFWDGDLDALSAMLDELDLQDEKDMEAAKEAAEGRRRKVGHLRGRAPAPAVVTKRKVERAESKMLAAPLVDNAANDLGPTNKSVSGLGE